MKSDAEDNHVVKPDAEADAKSPEIPSRKRHLIFWVTWLTALIAACPSPLGIALVPFFPLGLAAIMFHSSGTDEYINLAIVLGWVGYFVLSFFVVSSKTKRRFQVFYTALLITLLLNIGGCHQVLKGLSKLH